MFQTDIHTWLQQFDNEWLIQFFKAITALGYTKFFMVSLIIIIFGVHFRKGFILLLIVMWTAAVTLILKNSFDLPRPYMVENEVQLWDKEVETDLTLLDDADANYFFELLPTTTTTYFKNQPISYGFPSGHTSIAVVFWGTLMLLFRQRWLSILSITLIVLVPFSRIYLGVHFIADVLGGYLVGSFMLWVFYRLVIAPKAMKRYLSIHTHSFRLDLKNFMILIAPLFLLLVLENPKYWIVPAVLWGFCVGFMVLSQKGLPIETGTVPQRIGRVVSALFFFVGLGFLLKIGLENLGLGAVPIIAFFRDALMSFVIIGLMPLLHMRLKWVKR